MPGVKGKTNNPHGRPRTGEAFVEQLREALSKVEKQKGMSLIEHAVAQSYVDSQVMVAILKKILPDKIEDVSENPVERIILIRHAGNKA